jgi:hypothetical protein
MCFLVLAQECFKRKGSQCRAKGFCSAGIRH